MDEGKDAVYLSQASILTYVITKNASLARIEVWNFGNANCSQRLREVLPGNIPVLAGEIIFTKLEQGFAFSCRNLGEEVGGFVGGREGHSARARAGPEAADLANFQVDLMGPSLMKGLKLVEQFRSVRCL